MSAATVRRTLIRSTPEVWAEVSDAAALARHLGELGAIRITRLEEEAAVAWESERATGTVTLEASGLGTRVTLTAQPVTSDGAEPSRADPSPATQPPRAEPTPATQPPRAEPTPVGSPAGSPAEPQTVTPRPSRPVLLARRRSDRPRLLDRLRNRTRLSESSAEARGAPPPATFGPGDATRPAAQLPVPPAPAVAAPPERPSPPAPSPRAPSPPPPPETAAAESFDSERVTELLTNVLDQLGAARHRPFGAA